MKVKKMKKKVSGRIFFYTLFFTHRFVPTFRHNNARLSILRAMKFGKNRRHPSERAGAKEWPRTSDTLYKGKAITLFRVKWNQRQWNRWEQADRSSKAIALCRAPIFWIGNESCVLAYLFSSTQRVFYWILSIGLRVQWKPGLSVYLPSIVHGVFFFFFTSGKEIIDDVSFQTDFHVKEFFMRVYDYLLSFFINCNKV